MTLDYFSFVPDDGVILHATSDEARQRCEEALEWFRREANDDGWSEDVEGIVWGSVRGRSEVCDVKTREAAKEEGDEDLVYTMDSRGVDEVIDYRLVDVPLPE
jgi:hypothetical protein